MALIDKNTGVWCLQHGAFFDILQVESESVPSSLTIHGLSEPLATLAWRRIRLG